MLGEEDLLLQKKGGACRCSPKVKAEFLIRNEMMLSGDYKTPVRARVKIGGAGEQTVMVEEWVEWSIEKSPLFMIKGTVGKACGNEMMVNLNVQMNCIMGCDFERGSKKLAIPHQIILPSQINSLGSNTSSYLCLTKLVTLKPTLYHQFSTFEG